jgi:sugar transferase (PEP-CTERM/EpsH1 system associated)
VKILCLSPILPDRPADGDRLRLHHLLRGLAGHGHEITLAAYCGSGAEKAGADFEALRRFVKAVHLTVLSPGERRRNAAMAFFSGQPLTVASMESQAFDRLTADLTAREKFDAVFCHRVKMAPHALQLKGLPAVLDFTDSMAAYFGRRAEGEGNPVFRWLWRLEESRLQRFESRMAARFAISFANSQADARRLGPAVQVLANGVDTDHFRPVRQRRLRHQLVFVGNMVYPPNVRAMRDFCGQVLPRLQARIPDLKLAVVGGNPAPEIRALASNPGVEVTGWVADTRPWVRQAEVSICPVFQGAGRQNKVLESLALGTPVVASPLAAEGIEARDGQELMVAKEGDSFVEAICRLFDRPVLGRALAARGRRFVEKKYRWEEAVSVLEKGLKTAVKGRNPK